MTQETISLIMVIATFLSVFVALFGEQIRNCWFGPKLTIRLNNDVGELTTIGDGKAVRYYHLLVENKRQTIARNTGVYLTQVEETWDGGKRELWSGEILMPWIFPQFSATQERSIGPKQSQRSDLITISSDVLTIQTLVAPNNLKLCWNHECNIYLKVFAKSDETVSKPLTIHIVWDGQWDTGNDEMKRHLSIKNVEL